jgi:hypothetical protein
MHHVAHAAGHWYTSGAVMGWTAIGVAVVSIMVSIIIWRLREPRERITWSVQVSPLQPTSDQQQQIASPYLIQLRVDSLCLRDIASSDFDAGKPLVFDIGARVVIPLRIEGHAVEADAMSQYGSKVRIAPMLIRWGVLLDLHLITDGRPDPILQKDPLRNVKVTCGNIAEYDPVRRLAATGISAGSPGEAAFAIGIARDRRQELKILRKELKPFGLGFKGDDDWHGVHLEEIWLGTA